MKKLTFQAYVKILFVLFIPFLFFLLSPLQPFSKLIIPAYAVFSPSPTFYCIVGQKNNCVEETQPTRASSNTTTVNTVASDSGNTPTEAITPDVTTSPSQAPCLATDDTTQQTDTSTGMVSDVTKLLFQLLQQLFTFLAQLLGITPAPGSGTILPMPCNSDNTGSPTPSEVPSTPDNPSTTAPTATSPATKTPAKTAKSKKAKAKVHKKTSAKTPAKKAAKNKTSVPKTASGSASTTPGNTAANTSKCGGKYPLSNPRKKNFGDPGCNFTKNALYTLLKTQDAANASKWFNTVVRCESSYNPNAYASPAIGTPDKGGAWGLFQMGQGKNGTYDHGDVAWALQSSNAVNYNNKVIKGNWRYWACAKAFWK